MVKGGGGEVWEEEKLKMGDDGKERREPEGGGGKGGEGRGREDQVYWQDLEA